MSYSSGEDDLLTRLRAMPDWDGNNTSRQDWTILATGISDHYAILRPGPYENQYISIGGITAQTTWNTVIEIFQRYDTPGADPKLLQALVDDTIRELETYPFLGNAVGAAIRRAEPSGGEEMQEQDRDNIKWATWEVNIEWQEERTVTPAE